jgi:hypothetical protein
VKEVGKVFTGARLLEQSALGNTLSNKKKISGFLSHQVPFTQYKTLNTLQTP